SSTGGDADRAAVDHALEVDGGVLNHDTGAQVAGNRDVVFGGGGGAGRGGHVVAGLQGHVALEGAHRAGRCQRDVLTRPVYVRIGDHDVAGGRGQRAQREAGRAAVDENAGG